MLILITQLFYRTKSVINMTEEEHNNINAKTSQAYKLIQYKDINSKTADEKTHSPIPKQPKEIIKQKDKE